MHFSELPIRNQKVVNTLRLMAQDVVPVSGAKIAAAIVQRGNIISFGINQNRTHPLQAKWGKNSKAIFLHAEICAIKNALRHNTADYLMNTTMIVYRARRSNVGPKHAWYCGSATPCVAGCQAAIEAFGISKVISSTDDKDYFQVWNKNDK